MINKMLILTPITLLIGMALLFTVIYSEPDAPAAPPATTQEHAPAPPADPMDENRIFTLINEERTANGLLAYTYDEVLEREVQQHAEELCTTEINHDLFMAKAPTLEYKSFRIGENLAHNVTGSKQTVEGWKASEKHYEAMMSTLYNETGIGIAECGYTTVVVQWFGINQ